MQYKVLDKQPSITLSTDNVQDYNGDALVISADNRLTFDFSRKEHIDLLNGVIPIITNPSTQEVIDRFSSQYNTPTEFRDILPAGSAHLVKTQNMPFNYLIYAV